MHLKNYKKKKEIFFFRFSFFFFNRFIYDMSYTQDEFDNTSLNTPHSQDKEKKRDEMAGIHKDRPGSNGLAGLVKNPYVFCTAIFASIGGILFGCK